MVPQEVDAEVNRRCKVYEEQRLAEATVHQQQLEKECRRLRLAYEELRDINAALRYAAQALISRIEPLIVAFTTGSLLKRQISRRKPPRNDCPPRSVESAGLKSTKRRIPASSRWSTLSGAVYLDHNHRFCHHNHASGHMRTAWARATNPMPRTDATVTKPRLPQRPVQQWSRGEPCSPR